MSANLVEQDWSVVAEDDMAVFGERKWTVDQFEAPEF